MLWLQPAGSTPPGFVGMYDWGRPYWLQEREVTCGEYLEFLNHPGTLAEIDAGARPARYPREAANADSGGYWERGPDGRFQLKPPWREDMPVLGVSWRDANAFAAWRTREARTRGEPWSYRLPTYPELLAQQPFTDHWLYPFGDRFRPHWISSCCSRPTTAVEPVLSYPVDESPYGAFDLAGSAAEWTADWFDESRGQRALFGGSWAQATPLHFEQGFVRGDGEEVAEDTYGFRLLAELGGG